MAIQIVAPRSESGAPRVKAALVGLRRPRETLNRRANARIKAMMAAGLLGEVRKLREKYERDAPAFNGFGYGELWDHLDGLHDEEKALEMLRRNTHRYAKRQLTWFRSDRRVRWVDLSEDATADDVAGTVLSAIADDRRE